MSMLIDPDMSEIVDGFVIESKELYQELTTILEDYEDAPNQLHLEKFGQVIDRVMGAAKSIEADKTGHLCELGKTISYKASQSTDKELLNIVIAVLFDTIEILEKIIASIEENRTENVAGFNFDQFSSRLRWLSKKFEDIKRSSVAIDPIHEQEEDQQSIDALLTSLGL
jgi:chemotaxis protein histidine kinase CheA